MEETLLLGEELLQGVGAVAGGTTVDMAELKKLEIKKSLSNKPPSVLQASQPYF